MIIEYTITYVHVHTIRLTDPNGFLEGTSVDPRLNSLDLQLPSSSSVITRGPSKRKREDAASEGDNPEKRKAQNRNAAAKVSLCGSNVRVFLLNK